MSGWYDESQRLTHLLDEKVSGLLAAERDSEPGKRSTIDTLGDAYQMVHDTCEVFEMLRGQLRAALARQLAAIPTDRQRRAVAASIGVEWKAGGATYKYDVEKYKAHLAAYLADEFGDYPPAELARLVVDTAFAVGGVTENTKLRVGASEEAGIWDLKPFRMDEGHSPPSVSVAKLRR